MRCIQATRSPCHEQTLHSTWEEVRGSYAHSTHTTRGAGASLGQPRVIRKGHLCIPEPPGPNSVADPC